MSALRKHEPTDRVPVIIDGEVGLQQLVHLFDGHLARHPEHALAERLDHGLVGVELVDDLTHELLDQVLQGDHARGPPVLVDHDGDVEFPRLHLAQQRSNSLGLGHIVRHPSDSLDPPVLIGTPYRTHQVLSECDPDDVVDGLPVDRDPAIASGDRQLEHLLDERVRIDGDHVGPGHHHLAHDGVTELDDLMDERPLVGLDRLVLEGDVGKGEQLGLGHVARAGPRAPSWRDDPGNPDQQSRDPTHGREPDDRRHDRRREQSRPIGVPHCPLFGNRLGEDEDDRDLERRGRCHAPPPEEVGGYDTDQRGCHQLAQQDHQKHRRQETLRVLHQPLQCPRTPVPPIDERLRLRTGGAGQAGLGQRERGRAGEQQEDHGEDRAVGSGERGRYHRPSSSPADAVTWWRSNSSTSSASIASASASTS